MPRHDDVPQTVGEAIQHGWQWLGVYCALCRKGRACISLTRRSRAEPLADVAARCYCKACGKVSGRAYLNFELVAEHRSVWKKPIAFSGRRAIKIGMH